MRPQVLPAERPARNHALDRLLHHALASAGSDDALPERGHHVEPAAVRQSEVDERDVDPLRFDRERRLSVQALSDSSLAIPEQVLSH